MFNSVKENIKGRLQAEVRENAGQETMPKQKAVIIIVVIILAFMLWLVVNLNRSYTINLQVPLVLGQVSSNQALAEALPKNVTASVSGEGWNLLSIYRNPPRVFIEVSNQQVNLFEQVRRQIQAASNLSVQKVDPLYLQIQLQERVTKKVPVVPRVEANFATQFGFLESPHVQPDSITVSGARSVISGINYWVTDSLKLKNLKENVAVQVPLKEAGPLITLSEQNVQFTAEVAQFTEGEATVSVEIRGFRPGRNVIFSPQEVEITYLAPIEEFPQLKGHTVFAAYVSYSQLMQDTTGFVAPKVVQLADSVHVKVQQIQPRQVAYFNVVRN